jgi:hypothetical protein
MRIGDLVKNVSSERGMLGIIVSWHFYEDRRMCPVVRWSDGRTNWIMPHLVKLVS